MAHRSNSVPRVAGEPTVWIAQKNSCIHAGAKCRSEMIDRMDIHITVAPHICIASKGLASGLVAGTRDLYHFWCKQEGCDKSKVCSARPPHRTAHIEVRPLKVFSAVAAIDVGAIGRGAR